jgi:hypothetical protein
MPKHHGQRQRPVAVHDVPIAHAHPRSLDLNPHLACLRRFLLKVQN